MENAYVASRHLRYQGSNIEILNLTNALSSKYMRTVIALALSIFQCFSNIQYCSRVLSTENHCVSAYLPSYKIYCHTLPLHNIAYLWNAITVKIVIALLKNVSCICLI